jgi:DNA replication protein DnaC
MALWVEAWTRAAATNRRDRGTFLVLAGPAGVGKTHCCRRVARFLRDYAIDFWMANLWPTSRVPAVQFSVFSRVAGLERREWEDWLQDATEAAWIILDDVGSETDRYRTGEPAERLRRVLDLARSRFVLISTNVPSSAWKDSFDARAADRLTAARTLDLGDVPSYRANGKV